MSEDGVEEVHIEGVHGMTQVRARYGADLDIELTRSISSWPGHRTHSIDIELAWTSNSLDRYRVDLDICSRLHHPISGGWSSASEIEGP